MTVRLILAVLATVSVCGASAKAQQGAEPREDPAYVAYDRGNELGRSMFVEAYQVKGTIWRTVEVLEICGQTALADAVDGLDADKEFLEPLNDLIAAGRFAGLADFAFLFAQAAANDLNTGYRLGYADALKFVLDLPNVRRAVCDAGVTSANELLKR